MELQEAIARRRTIRDFSEQKINPDIINKALFAGLKAPSHNHLKQWYFILVSDQEKRIALIHTEKMIESVTDELEESFRDYDKLSKQMYLNAIPKQKRMILSAPELLVVVYKPKTQITDSKRIYDLNCLASVWCCIENILLSLAEDNIFGVTFIPQNTKAVKEVLSIPPELEVAAIIPFGYKANNATLIPQKEARLEDRLFRNRWTNGESGLK